MEERHSVPFPQANDFKKIIDIIDIIDESLLIDKNYLMAYLNLGTERQIAYYLSACEFLGLITKDKKFTIKAYEIKSSSFDSKIYKLSQYIVSLPVFGEVFFLKYLSGTILSIDDISQLIGTIYNIENEEVCRRRASTVVKWISWIENNKKLYMDD